MVMVLMSLIATTVYVLINTHCALTLSDQTKFNISMLYTRGRRNITVPPGGNDPHQSCRNKGALLLGHIRYIHIYMNINTYMRYLNICRSLQNNVMPNNGTEIYFSNQKRTSYFINHIYYEMCIVCVNTYTYMLSTNNLELLIFLV